MRKTKREALKQLNRRMYPPKPWINPRDLYGKKKWQELEALGKGEIGKIYGATIVIT
jgi:hypothetical protein